MKKEMIDLMDKASVKLPFLKPFIENAYRYLDAKDLHAARATTDILYAVTDALRLVPTEAVVESLTATSTAAKEMSREALEAHFIAFTLETGNMKAKVMVHVEGLVTALGGTTQIQRVNADGSIEQGGPESPIQSTGLLQ